MYKSFVGCKPLSLVSSLKTPSPTKLLSLSLFSCDKNKNIAMEEFLYTDIESLCAKLRYQEKQLKLKRRSLLFLIFFPPIFISSNYMITCSQNPTICMYECLCLNLFLLVNLIASCHQFIELCRKFCFNFFVFILFQTSNLHLANFFLFFNTLLARRCSGDLKY